MRRAILPDRAGGHSPREAGAQDTTSLAGPLGARGEIGNHEELVLRSPFHYTTEATRDQRGHVGENHGDDQPSR